MIGRDLIRLLSYLSRVEPFQKLWEDIFTDFSSLSSNEKGELFFPFESVVRLNNISLRYLGVFSILDTLTPGHFTNSLISQEMDKTIRWILLNVHYAPNFPFRRYQDLFSVSLSKSDVGL